MNWIIAILLIWQVTEILVEGDHALCKLYRWLMSWPSRIHLYDEECGWCTSVWVGAIVGFLFKLSVGQEHLGFMEHILCGIALSRVANFVHNVYNRHYKGLPLQIALFKNDLIPEPTEEEKEKEEDAGS